MAVVRSTYGSREKPLRRVCTKFVMLMRSGTQTHECQQTWCNLGSNLSTEYRITPNEIRSETTPSEQPDNLDPYYNAVDPVKNVYLNVSDYHTVL